MNTANALAWIANVFAMQGRELHVDDTRASVAEWDSLGDLLLLSTLEEDLGIVISADEIAAITSIGEILALMDKHDAFRSD
jgi:acyl carrier protein